MGKSSFLLFVFLLSMHFSQAQRRSLQSKSTTIQPNTSTPTKANQSPSKINTTKAIPVKSGNGYWTFGLQAHTNAGLIGGINFKKAWGKDPNRLSFIGIDLLKTEDYREYTYTFPGSNTSIQDAKTNYLYTIRPTIGKEFVLLKKGPDDGASLKAIVSTGPSIGLVSPYYLNVATNPYGAAQTQTLKMVDLYNNAKSQTYYIAGPTGMFYGLSESTIQPGWHAKTGLLIEFPSVKQNYLAVEFGFQVDSYFKPIEMVYLNAGRNTFSSAYITFHLGKK